MSALPKKGDIITLNFDPQVGHEQKKRRPALVISETKFNKFGLAVVCPITSKDPRHGFHIQLPKNLKTTGCVMTEQLKSLDIKARKGKFVEQVPTNFIISIKQIIAQFL